MAIPPSKAKPKQPGMKDYYKVLRVARNADLETIKRAYEELQERNRYHVGKLKEIQLAWSMLRDPESRSHLDNALLLADMEAKNEAPVVVEAAKTVSPRNRWKRAKRLLVFMLLFGAVVLFYVHGHWGYRMKRFSAGDALYAAGTSTKAGEILRAERAHVFPNGREASAFLVRTTDGREVWLPKHDVQAKFDRAAR